MDGTLETADLSACILLYPNGRRVLMIYRWNFYTVQSSCSKYFVSSKAFPVSAHFVWPLLNASPTCFCLSSFNPVPRIPLSIAKQISRQWKYQPAVVPQPRNSVCSMLNNAPIISHIKQGLFLGPDISSWNHLSFRDGSHSTLSVIWDLASVKLLMPRSMVHLHAVRSFLFRYKQE